MIDTIASSPSVVGSGAWVAVALLMGSALFAMTMQKNMIRLCMGLSVLFSSVRLALALWGGRKGVGAVLPTTQFFSVILLVIAFAATTLALALAVMLCRHYGTLDVGEIRKLRE